MKNFLRNLTLILVLLMATCKVEAARSTAQLSVRRAWMKENQPKYAEDRERRKYIAYIYNSIRYDVNGGRPIKAKVAFKYDPNAPPEPINVGWTVAGSICGACVLICWIAWCCEQDEKRRMREESSSSGQHNE